jgi:hypothetical protein
MTAMEWLLVFALAVALWWALALFAGTRAAASVAWWIRRVRLAPPPLPAPVRTAWHRARTGAADRLRRPKET